MEKDYEYLAKSLSSLSGLPVRLYINGTFSEIFCGAEFKPDIMLTEERSIFSLQENINYHIDENLLLYGIFRVNGTDASLVIGPVSTSKVDTHSAAAILRKIGEPVSRTAELRNYFGAMPSYPLRVFLQILCTVNYFINGEKTDVESLISAGTDEKINFPQKNTEFGGTLAETVPGDEIHNTADIEKKLLSIVQYGRTDELGEFLKSTSGGRAGTLAETPLRQSKNLFICTATLVSRAAIKGGLDPETALGLSDMYIQKCELTSDYVSVSRLSIEMITDFTRRVEKTRCGESCSKLLLNIKNYILAHISEKLTTEKIAAYSGKSRTYLCTVFREQTGLTVNGYVMKIKMEEAERLLASGGRSTAEIADYLGFSSQSHFQNKFREYFGSTPGQYKKSLQV